jgi:hypothetical protein
MSILAILAEKTNFFAIWRRFALPTDPIDTAISCIAPSKILGKNGVFRSCEHDILAS